MTFMFMSSTILTLLALPTLSTAWSWQFDNRPQQCQNLTISVMGSGGVPPYRVTILPFGPSPLPNNIEARKIMDIPFPGQSASITFQLNYPGISQFVAVLSDATGFGSGGTSVAAIVTNTSDTSCFNPTTNVTPLFVFQITPANQIVQCLSTRISWDPSTVQGTPNFLGVIPGGQSFAVPEANITNVDGEGTGFSWIPNLRGGTTLILVAGDNRGNGTGGSILSAVGSGNNINSCLSNSSPSSTPGSPAGGSYPTSTSEATGFGAGSQVNVGAIVGGVVGGVLVLAVIILLLFFYRRRAKERSHARHEKRALDILNADDEEDLQSATGGVRAGNRAQSRNELPEYYQPSPYTLPEPMLGSSFETDSEGRPLSGYTDTDRHTTTTDFLGSLYAGVPPDTPGSAAGSSTGRKGPLRQMRPVNIIQHDDAGPSEPAGEGEPETVELPPAYNNIRR